jgi:hypothetical protein
MTRVALVLILFLSIPFLTFGQQPAEELDSLRKHLGLPEVAAIEVGSTMPIPGSRPLRVYIAAGLDMRVRENFVRWLEEWNKKDGNRYGRMVLVTAISESDLVLARYTVRDKITTATRSQVVPGIAIDPTTGSTVTRPVARTYSSSLVPVYEYLLVRQDDRYYIVWRYADQTPIGEGKRSGRPLRDAFFRILKARRADKG